MVHLDARTCGESPRDAHRAKRTTRGEQGSRGQAWAEIQRTNGIALCSAAVKVGCSRSNTWAVSTRGVNVPHRQRPSVSFWVEQRFRKEAEVHNDTTTNATRRPAP
eukprot:10275-Prymnesium_polylepis.1